jgi:hypothetical protein
MTPESDPERNFMKYPTRVVAATALAVLTLTTACGGGSKPKATPTPTKTTASSTPVSTTPAPTTAAPVAPAVNPLTGVAPVPSGPVVAVKIDDTASARPMRNINQADVVYIEQVEGGLTRLLAVFATNKPVVGYVRSTRASDPELVAQYGPIDYVASGGAPNPLQVLDASPLKSTIEDRSGPGFVRDRNRYAPYNLTSDLAKVSSSLAGGGSKDVGFTWSADATALAAAPVGNSLSTKVGATAVRFDYDPASGRYIRVINGTQQKQSDGALVSTPNVIVQFCSVTSYPADIDVNGNPSQFTHTTGSGTVSIFRNGKRIDGTWSRASDTSPTTFTGADGKPIALNPGGTWVVLAANGTALTSS